LGGREELLAGYRGIRDEGSAMSLREDAASEQADVSLLVRARTSPLPLSLKNVTEIGEHTIAFLAAIVSIWIVHLALGYLLGHDATFYDRIPVRYVIDTGHLAVLIRFVWKLVLQIGKKK
jgi:hypothetical protein